MIYVFLFGVILGQATFYGLRWHVKRAGGPARALWRLFTGWRVRLNDPVNLIIERQPASAIPEAWLERYHNAIFTPAIDDLTGASVFEVNVKDWSVVRMLELNIWGCYWHTRAGEYLPAGITPVEEAEQEAARKDARNAEILAAQEAAKAKWDAAHPADPCVTVPQTWWAVKMAAAELELEQEDPPYPWGAGVTKRLRDADVMLPPIERMLKWDYTQNDNYLALTVYYEGGTIYRAIRNHAGVWNVTVGSLGDLTNALIASGIVS